MRSSRLSWHRCGGPGAMGDRITILLQSRPYTFCSIAKLQNHLQTVIAQHASSEKDASPTGTNFPSSENSSKRTPCYILRRTSSLPIPFFETFIIHPSILGLRCPRCKCGRPIQGNRLYHPDSPVRSDQINPRQPSSRTTKTFGRDDPG